jgi:hypothetical protein
MPRTTVLDGSDYAGKTLYVVGAPGVRSAREPELRGLIRDHERGELEPIDVALGGLPAGASEAMRDVAADIRLLLGLRLAVDEDRPLPYSARFCAEAAGQAGRHEALPGAVNPPGCRERPSLRWERANRVPN